MKSLITLICLAFLLGGCAKLEQSFSKIPIKGTKPNWKSAFFTHWAKDLSPKYETGNLPVTLQSPVIDSGLLFVGEGIGTMNAYEADSGRLAWTAKHKGTLHAAPFVHDRVLYYGTSQGRFYARSSLSGEVKYMVDLGSATETTPQFFKGRLYLQLRNHRVVSLDALTGKILWSYKRTMAITTTLQKMSRPLIYQNKVILGAADGYIIALRYEDGGLLWEQKISAGERFLDVDRAPSIIKGKLWVSAALGPAVILDPRNGTILRRLSRALTRSPILHQSLYWAPTLSGELIALDENFEIKRKMKISKRSLFSIRSVSQSRLLATSDDGRLYLVDTGKMALIDNFSLGHSTSSVMADLVEGENRLAVLSSRYRLYVFDLKRLRSF